jgi:hypothetical protein
VRCPENDKRVNLLAGLLYRRKYKTSHSAAENPSRMWHDPGCDRFGQINIKRLGWQTLLKVPETFLAPTVKLTCYCRVSLAHDKTPPLQLPLFAIIIPGCLSLAWMA